jgi:hypothetical protein
MRMTFREFRQLDDDEQRYLCEFLGIQFLAGHGNHMVFRKIKKPLSKAAK